MGTRARGAVADLKVEAVRDRSRVTLSNVLGARLCSARSMPLRRPIRDCQGVVGGDVAELRTVREPLSNNVPTRTLPITRPHITCRGGVAARPEHQKRTKENCVEGR